jgi:hypothetical protein
MRYDRVLQQPLTVLQRFKIADGEFFFKQALANDSGQSEEHLVSTVGVPHFIRAIDAQRPAGDVVASILQGRMHSPVQALDELSAISADYNRYLEGGTDAFTKLALVEPAKLGALSLAAILEVNPQRSLRRQRNSANRRAEKLWSKSPEDARDFGTV